MSTLTITEFLEARIAEDERGAQNASPGPWAFSDIDSIGGGTIYDQTVAIANVEWDTEHVDSRIRRTRPSRQADATGEHIARHDPARVLAECAAKRAIVAAHPIVDDVVEVSTRIKHGFACETCFSYGDIVEDNGYCDTLRALAAAYADHADYQQEWAL